MAQFSNHYQTLDVCQTASHSEIKQAYRRLAKKFHPDSNRETVSHDRIAQINAAYEVLGDPQSRRSYDRELLYQNQVRERGVDSSTRSDRQQRTAAAQARHRQQRQAEQDTDEQIHRWLERVYSPVSRLLSQILNPLKRQINDLAADPFDHDLMEEFQAYLEDCHYLLSQAQRAFQSMPNPPAVAGVAAHLYYCLNQVSDGLEELQYFTLNYDEHYLHTGQELFRISQGLLREARIAVREIPQ